MRPITLVIVEDDEQFSNGLKVVLESQTIFPCKVHTLNPVESTRTQTPTFEEFCNEIEAITEPCWPFYIVLMDNQLGNWKWKGANLAPSFEFVMSISNADSVRWADYHFSRKADLALRDDESAKQQFLATVVEFLKKILPPEWANQLQ